MMIVPILILVSSLLFLASFLNHNFLNSTKKLLLHVKKPSPPTNNRTDNTNNDDGLKRVFDTFDKNGDGFITREELKESLNNIGIIVPAKEVEEMVDNMDSNKDGLIDLSEFKELFGLVKKREEEKGGVFDHEGELKEAFDVFDEDKDGLITVQELGLVLSSLGLKEGNREEVCKEMIRKVDVDGDGMVSFNEFKIMMKSGCAF